MRVAREEGRAVRAADAKGPCWDLNNALRASVKPGHTTSDTNLVSSCLVAFCCQLCRGWLGSGSASAGRGMRQLGPRRQSQPCLFHTSLHCRAAWKQGTPPTSRCLIIDSAMTGCLFLTILSASAQLAKWAALLTLCALESPNPPADKANDAINCAPSNAEGVPKMLLKHLHTEASWRSAKLSVFRQSSTRS